MTRWPVFVWIALVSWGAASAQPMEDMQAAPKGRVSVSSALSLRGGQVTSSSLTLGYAGISPAHVRLSGALFPWESRVGMFSDFSYEWFTLSSLSSTAPLRMAMRGFRLAAGGTARFRPGRAVSLEAQLGYGFNRLPGAHGVGLLFEDASVSYHGPLLGVLTEVRTRGPVDFGFRLTWLPRSFRAASPVGNGRAGALTVDAHVLFGTFRFAGTRLRPMAEYELLVAAARGTQLDAGQVAHRLGVGLRMELPDPKALAYVPSGPAEVRGKVLLADSGMPAVGAEVVVGSMKALMTDSRGSFRAQGVAPGAVTVRIALAGYKATTRELQLMPEQELQISVGLEKPTGPGTIRGLVFVAGEGSNAAKTPLANAAVEMQGAGAVLSGADGTFALDKAGPGPVAIKVRAAGFSTVEEIIAVPPEGVANVELLLRKKGVKTLATIRGRVRAISGAAVPAVLSIPEAKVRTRADKQGKFNVRLPGGTYTVQFEAPGYYKQTKSVEVADGDQALFYIDLTPVD